jgi:hypothetical protein
LQIALLFPKLSREQQMGLMKKRRKRSLSPS